MARPSTRARAAKPAPRAPANKQRGESTLTLGGTTYRLRPSFEAIEAMEEETGLSLIELTRLSDRGGMRLRQVGIVAGELIRAGAEDELTRLVDNEQIAKLAMAQGMPGVVARLTVCLASAVMGGRDAEGNAKAATA